MQKWQILRAHILELEELVEDLLADARTGDDRSRTLVVSLHREVMEKRQRLKAMCGNLDQDE